MINLVAIPAGSSTICLDNIYTSGLPDLVVMRFVLKTAFARSYTENCYNFTNFKIKQINFVCNGMRVSRYGYQPNFTKRIYKTDYFMFTKQLGFD